MVLRTILHPTPPPPRRAFTSTSTLLPQKPMETQSSHNVAQPLPTTTPKRDKLMIQNVLTRSRYHHHTSFIADGRRNTPPQRVKEDCTEPPHIRDENISYMCARSSLVDTYFVDITNLRATQTKFRDAQNTPRAPCYQNNIVQHHCQPTKRK